MNKTKIFSSFILVVVVVILTVGVIWLSNLLKSNADINKTGEVGLLDNNPQIIPTQTSYLFEIQLAKILPSVGISSSSDCLNNNNVVLLDAVEWTATAGRFDPPKIFNSKLVILYHAPYYPVYNVKVTATLKNKPSAYSTIYFNVTQANITLDQNPFPHNAKHRIASSQNSQGNIPASSIRYLEKYSKLTIEGDNLKEAALVKSKKPDIVNLRFVQSGTEYGARTFALGLNPATFLPANYKKGDPINLAWLQQGKPYEDQPWWGHLLYHVGAPLAKDLPAAVNSIYENLELTFEGDLTTTYQPGDYLLFFDLDSDSQNKSQPPNNQDAELVRVLPKENSQGVNPVRYDSGTKKTVVILESRGQINLISGDIGSSTSIPIYSKSSSHKKGTVVRKLSLRAGYGGFRYNFSHFSQKSNLKNPEGLDSHDWLALFLIRKLNRDFATDLEYPANTLSGWQFDVTPYWSTEFDQNSSQIDSDLDNIADGATNYTEYPKGQDVLGEGRLAFFQKLKNWAGENRLIVGDGHSNRGYDSLNGTEFEGFPHFLSGNTETSLPYYIAGYNAQLLYYKNLWTNSKVNLNSLLYSVLFTKRPNAIFYNTTTNPDIPETVRRQETNNLYRLDMASTMLSGGYYIYSPHPDTKINLYDGWTDEFDGGLGSSLKKDVPKLTVRADINKIYIFDEVYQAFDGQFKTKDRWLIDQEEIEVVSFEKTGQDPLNNNLNFGKLLVYRARNDSNPTRHARGTKLLKIPDEVNKAGKGYLGKPLESAQNLAKLDSKNIVSNGNFDNQTANWTLSADTQLTVYNDKNPSRNSSLEIKSKKLDLLASSSHPAQGFDDPNLYVSQTISLKRNTEYTLRFFAKADRTRTVEISLIRKGTGDLLERTIPIDPIEIYPLWKEYQLSFVTPKGAGAAFSDYVMKISGYREYETFSLDNVRINKNGWHIYKREFEKGLVLINGTSSEVTFNLANKNYQKIKGTQDFRVHDGSSVSGKYTVPARDAIILLKR